MSANVFANGREVSAKADGNKSIAGMPDVCLSPPSPPAGPIPIPYPNFSNASKTSSGSKKVKIGNKEVGLKNKSVYKSSKGDEAATRSFGMGLVTHKLSGATKHAAWSFDVKVEGQNAIRFLDLTTHNHASDPMDTGSTTVDLAKPKPGMVKEPECSKLDSKNQKARDEEIDMPDEGGIAVTAAFVKPPEGKLGQIWKSTSQPDLVDPLKTSGYRMTPATGEIPECAELKKNGENKKWSRRGNDSEPRILNPEMAANPSGKLIKMKIWHRDAEGTEDALPCWSCREAICGAEKCGITIILCNNNNEEVNANPELCKDGVPKPVNETPDSEAKKQFWRDKGFGPFN